MSVKMEVWGETACFTRPEMKAERVSYDVPTPSARQRNAGKRLLSSGPEMAH